MRAPPSPQLRAALAAHSQGDFARAEQLYRGILASPPEPFEALHNLGHVLVQQGRFAEAADHFERALVLRPDATVSHNMLASALRRLNRREQAIIHYRRALALRPGYPQAHHDLGRLLAGLGRLEEARASIEAALKLAPERGEYYLSLSEVLRFTEGDPRLAAMQALSRNPDLAPGDRISLCYALGKAYADLGRHEAAFEQFTQGAGLMRRHVDYDEAATLAMFKQMQAIFSPQLFAAKSGFGRRGVAPIFILGMPRSGSTLVEQIVAAHHKVTGGGELTAFRDVAAATLGRPEAIAGLDAAALTAMADRYLEAACPGADRFTDKMPANFLLAGLIHLALPDARIIHTTRDPVDTCLSCFTTLFADGHPYSYDLDELGRHQRGYLGLMDHWRRVLPPGVMIDVAYDDVVFDLEGQTRRMLEHCALDWDRDCLDFQSGARPVWTASAAQVRRPLYASSVRRWRPPQETLRALTDGLTG